MKPITEEEILKSNRFVKWRKQKAANPNAAEKYVTKAVRYIPTREEAMKMNLRTLGLFVAVESLSMRTAKDAVRNAEYWMARGRKEIIDAFFPAPRKFDLNDLF
ncbi:MAG: hypothetical protein OSJ56_14530, partial [Prevotella sp.]|jgi:hypothetical protein|nr:hypothetical protein [Prevotella sp.]ROS93430.1 hypothetical protein EEL36_04545 [Muribaculaceae bacterium Isolate-043 (Harlan)]